MLNDNTKQEILSTPKEIMRSIRDYTGKSQRQAAVSINKSQSVYAKYETGDTIPPSDLLIHYMNHLVSVNGVGVLFDILLKQEPEAKKTEGELTDIITKLAGFQGDGFTEERKLLSDFLDLLTKKVSSK